MIVLGGKRHFPYFLHASYMGLCKILRHFDRIHEYTSTLLPTAEASAAAIAGSSSESSHFGVRSNIWCPPSGARPFAAPVW